MEDGTAVWPGAIEAARHGGPSRFGVAAASRNTPHKKMRPRSDAATDGDRWGA
jgi:hypothetical protein